LPLANYVIFWLAAGVWMSSILRAIRMPERLQAGTLGVNTYLTVSFTSPFGGHQERDRAQRG
jgi:aldehyde dehydrogenase (NAD+)